MAPVVDKSGIPENGDRYRRKVKKTGGKSEVFPTGCYLIEPDYGERSLRLCRMGTGPKGSGDGVRSIQRRSGGFLSGLQGEMILFKGLDMKP